MFKRYLNLRPKRFYTAAQNPSNNIRKIGIGAASLILLSGIYYYSRKSNPQPQVEQKKSNTSITLPTISNTAKFFNKESTTVVFILGGPGAGKGTQCANLVRDYNFVHLSAGDLLREERNRAGSQYGELINTYIKEGKIVPMEITISLLDKSMKEYFNKDGTTRFLIDGFPRKMDQGLKFEELVVESKLVLYFECPEESMLERLLKRGETSGRVDDNVESIRKRFQTFRETSYPVIEYYAKLGKVRTVSCLGSTENVYSNVRKVFDELFKDEKSK